MRYINKSTHPIESKPICKIRGIECFSIEGDQCRALGSEMVHCCQKSRRFFCNIAQQVLPDNQPVILKESDTEKDNRPGEKTHRLNIEENIILRFMEASCTKDMGMGFRMTVPDEFHDLS